MTELMMFSGAVSQLNSCAAYRAAYCRYVGVTTEMKMHL
jgi:hypothetical protein